MPTSVQQEFLGAGIKRMEFHKRLSAFLEEMNALFEKYNLVISKVENGEVEVANKDFWLYHQRVKEFITHINDYVRDASLS